MAFFHEVTERDYKKMQDGGWTWADITESYRQPRWCRYPDALGGGAGCWSLIFRHIRSVHDCAGCELCSTVFATGTFEDAAGIC